MTHSSDLEILLNHTVYLRLGRPLEVIDDIISLLTIILPEIIQKKVHHSKSIELILSSIMTCQENEDWLGLADYIEYDLIDLLQSNELD